jgi:O-antigen ligase
MATAAATARPRAEITSLALVTVVALGVAIARGRWTVLLVPVAWALVAILLRLPLAARFAALIGGVVLLPRYPLAAGLSVDDLIPAAAALVAIAYLVRERPPLPKVVMVAFGIWVVAAAASAAVNANGFSNLVRLALPAVGRPILWLVLVWTAAGVAARSGMRTLASPVAGVAIVEALIACLAFAASLSINIGTPATPANREIWESRRPIGVEQTRGTSASKILIRSRATGTIGQSSNFLGAYIVTTLPMIGAMAALVKGRRRLWYAAGGVAAFAALLLTFTRGALIAGVLGLVLFVVLALPRRALPWAIAALVVVGGAFLAVPQARARLSDVSSDRRALWYSGTKIFADNPVFGVGFGNYRKVQESNTARYVNTPYGAAFSTAHNGILAIAAEGGAFQAGAVLFLVLFTLASGWRAVRGARGSPEVVLIAGAFAGVVAFLIQSMTNTLFLVPSVATYFWILSGALIGRATLKASYT